MIRLEHLTKVFPNQDEPAVDDLSMDIYEGEIVVLVGPSGCGKTTTMKMINRLIEPSSGRIFLQGEDVTKVNSDKLRRRIGYVIQQIGLFPHMTIADNIATVPKMLGWDKKRISDRTDELLETVGIDLSYRDRYPKELSGGQRQRIGVARAMAADPSVLLMDEPFGAIDPITRDRLQDEFLRLQQEIRKTIVFVTHDIDEAIKMGDRIAILKQQSKIAQYDTPEKILTDPADDFVADVWLKPPAPANNTYAIAVRKEVYDKLGVKDLSDFKQLVEENPDEATICVGTEFSTRDDGLPGMEKAYNFEFPSDNIVKIDEGLIYQATNKGDKCNYGEVFATDGRIKGLGLELISDSKGFFPLYNPALTVNKKVLDDYPQIEKIFAPISKKLTTEELQKLNTQVDIDGQLPEDVAQKWLSENGFI